MPSQTVKKSAALLLAVILAAGGYLVASSRMAGLGFPLDDAWIHQTYARNLGQLGQWAFFPGQPSAGSTSVLWSALLSISFALRWADPRPWTYLLGGISLAGVAWLGERLWRILRAETAVSERWGWLPWAGLFLAGEYHLVWAAVSGMETDLMAALYLAGFVLLLAQRPRWGWIGCLCGLACWVRPDGLTLLGPVLLVGLWSRERWSALARLAGGFLLLFLPYLSFNYALQGTIWPNTFYAKQAEYALLQARPLLLRYWDISTLPLIGAGLLLLPGFCFFLYHSIRRRHIAGLAAGLWFGGFALLYAWRLPVTYQYGRYLIPAMPVYFVLGLAGMALWLDKYQERKGRLAAFAWISALTFVWFGFYFLGAGRYAQDVAIIETEMVPAARWVAQNTAPGDWVAAHDIGAMGYFGGRRILDLAGLISPEVTPIIRDERQLASLLDQRGARVLVVFSDWYQELPSGKTILYTAPGKIAPSHMTVYLWKP